VTGVAADPGPFDPYVASVVEAALRALDEKAGLDAVVLDLRGLVDSFDVLVLATGRSDRHVRTLAEHIEAQVAHAAHARPQHVEGWASAQWIALDFADVIVHVFDPVARAYYDLEHLWSAARTYRPQPTL
jgi:ribosome-associated protein